MSFGKGWTVIDIVIGTVKQKRVYRKHKMLHWSRGGISVPYVTRSYLSNTSYIFYPGLHRRYRSSIYQYVEDGTIEPYRRNIYEREDQKYNRWVEGTQLFGLSSTPTKNTRVTVWVYSTQKFSRVEPMVCIVTFLDVY